MPLGAAVHGLIALSNDDAKKNGNNYNDSKKKKRITELKEFPVFRAHVEFNNVHLKPKNNKKIFTKITNGKQIL